MSQEPTLHTQRVYQGHVVSLRVDTVGLRRGGTARREIVEHSPCVVIVPLDAQENVLLVRQYRKAVEDSLLEAPAGGVEEEEGVEAAVQRELQEETGYSARHLEPLGGFWMTPGYCTEFMHAYLATDLYPGSLPQDEDEDIEVVKVPLEHVSQMIRSGAIKDAKSVAALLMAFHLLRERARRN